MGNSLGGQISDSNKQKANALDKELQQAGFTKDKIDEMISTANDVIGCGPECQKAKKINRLRAKVNEISQQIKTGPGRLRDARRRLITTEHGAHAYTHSQMQQYREEADELIRNFRAEHTKDINDTTEAITQFAIAKQALDNANTIRSDEIAKYRKASVSVDNTTAAVRTNTRRSQYMAETLETLTTAEKIVMAGYYICLLYYSWKALFTLGQFRNIWVWIAIIVYAVFPFWILPLIGSALFWISSTIVSLLGLDLTYAGLYGKEKI